jgi:aminotransferase
LYCRKLRNRCVVKKAMLEHLINPLVKSIAISGIRQMATRVAQYKDVLSLTIGQPDFPTPEHIIEAAKRAADSGKTVYTPNAGLPELREAACAYVGNKYGLTYRAADEAIVTIGASESSTSRFERCSFPVAK